MPRKARTPDAPAMVSSRSSAPPQPSEDLALLIYSGLGLFLMAGAGLILYCLIAANRHPMAEAPATMASPPTAVVAPATEDWQAVLRDLRQRVEQPPAFTSLPSTRPPRVNEVIDHGVAYLKKEVARFPRSAADASPYQVGVAALAGLALLHCGVPPTDPAIVRITSLVRDGCGRIRNTYELSTMTWFLDRLGDPRDRSRIRSLAFQMISAQTVNGGWGYISPVLEPDQEASMLKELGTPSRRATEDLHLTARGRAPDESRVATPSPSRTAEPRAGKHGDSPPPSRRQSSSSPAVLTLRKAGPYDDNSVSQFAILALWVARKYGVPVDQSLAKAEARFRALQNSNGSWGYNLVNTRRRLDSMTCAGLLALAVGRGITHTKGGEDTALNRGLVFLGSRLGHAKPITAATREQIRRRTVNARSRMAEFLGLVQQMHQLTERIAELEMQLSDTNAKGRHEQKVLRDLVSSQPGNNSLASAKIHAQRLKRLLAEHDEILAKGKALQAQGNEAVRKAQAIYPSGENFHGTLVAANSWGDLYFLWSVERMAVVYDLKTIGGQDWYAWGSDIIMAGQQADGSWADAYPGVPDTSFALLFLKRANVATDLTAMQNLLGKVRDPGRARVPDSPPTRQQTPSPLRQHS